MSRRATPQQGLAQAVVQSLDPRNRAELARTQQLRNERERAEQFKAWRQRMGWTQADAAEQLEITPRTVQNYEAATDPHPIPRMVILACIALQHGLTELRPAAKVDCEVIGARLRRMSEGWRSTIFDGVQKTR